MNFLNTNYKPCGFALLWKSMVGFFAGLALAVTTAYVGIYESYQKTSSIVLNDVENLCDSVKKVIMCL